ncbi:MAG TPA: metallopeptidase TldD-related protein, partial [Rhodospirillales bacterium]|nr:metallopeptidase TldD-related protein [Rhodospirillales bacterium]
MTDRTDHLEELAAALLERATGAGAEAADVMVVDTTSISVSCRLGRTETLERSESVEAGLRVFIGKRQAMAASSDLSAEGMAALVERSLAMAGEVPEDPFCGLADAAQVCQRPPEIDSFDPSELSTESLREAALAAEDAARAVPGVTNSEGAEAAWGRSAVAVAASNGFAAAYRRSWNSLSASVLAAGDGGMERDYDYTAAVYAADLRPPGDVGRTAGERTVRRLNPQKAGSARVPVVYEPRAARSLIGHLAAAISGTAIARGTSFLKDRMGARLFPTGTDIIDDPLRPRGLKSRPVDHEGIATARRAVVSDGVLASWLLDLRSARQLGLATTGHGLRGTTSPPSPGSSNLYLAPGRQAPGSLIAGIDQGLYVTDLIGFGINAVTGDYSRGASGFWIENGEITCPVNEITIAGNLLDMFAN